MKVACLLLVAAHASYAQPAKVTVGGYVETYYQLNLSAPLNHITNLRAFDDRDRTFTLSNAALDAKAERGPVSARVILQVGSTPTAYYGTEQDWKLIQQATLAYATGKLVVDAGVFPSPVGVEVIPIKDNWNWSRSDLFVALPFYHAGARAAYALARNWTAMVHVYNGWNDIVDTNPYPSIAVSATHASKRLTGQVMYFGGIERPTGANEGKPWRHLLDVYATFAATNVVSVVAHVDAGAERNDIGTSGWVAAALYAKFQVMPQVYAAVRADYFREYVPQRAAAIFWPTPSLGSATATLAWQPVDGLSIRLELRHDQAKDPVYYGRAGANVRARDTVTLGAVAWF